MPHGVLKEDNSVTLYRSLVYTCQLSRVVNCLWWRLCIELYWVRGSEKGGGLFLHEGNIFIREAFRLKRRFNRGSGRGIYVIGVGITAISRGACNQVRVE